VITHQLQVECRTEKVRRRKTGVPPLYHAINHMVGCVAPRIVSFLPYSLFFFSLHIFPLPIPSPSPLLTLPLFLSFFSLFPSLLFSFPVLAFPTLLILPLPSFPSFPSSFPPLPFPSSLLYAPLSLLLPFPILPFPFIYLFPFLHFLPLPFPSVFSLPVHSLSFSFSMVEYACCRYSSGSAMVRFSS